MSKVLFVGLLAAWLALRIILGLLPGYKVDVDQMKSWALSAAIHGPTSVYQTATFDYPPLFIFLIHPVGELYLALHPEISSAKVRRGSGDVLLFRTIDGTTYRHPKPGRDWLTGSKRFEPLPGNAWFSFFVKLPGMLFDLLIAAILYGLVAIRGTWGTSQAGPRHGRLAVCCWLWNPAILWASGYWGATDAIHSALALAAIALLGTARWALAGAALAAAGLMKPLAAPLVPLLAWVAGARGGRGFASASAAGVGVAVLLFLPFFVADQGPTVLSRVLNDIEVMPFTSVNAHNLWWLIGGWVDANETQLLGLSGRTIGLGLFFSAVAGLLVANRRWLGTASDEAIFTTRLMFLAATLAGSFFMLSTHMHENHLFTAIPFLTAVAGRGRRFIYLTAGLTGVMLLNLVLHDPNLGMPTHGSPDPANIHGLATYTNACLALLCVGWLYWTAFGVALNIPDQERDEASETN